VLEIPCADTLDRQLIKASTTRLKQLALGPQVILRAKG
jgi:hypothetical protein